MFTRAKSWLPIPRKALRLACGLTLAVAIPLSNAPLLSAESKTSSAKDPKQVENEIKTYFGGKSPHEVIVQLRVKAKSRPLSPSESLTQARAYFANQEFAASLAIAQTLTGSFASDPKEAEHVHILIAEDFGALGKYSQAAYTASEAQKFFPESKPLAATRIGYYTKAGDMANCLIAEDHLRMLDPAFHQKPVCFGIDDVIIIGLVAYAAIVIFAPPDNVELTNRMILAVLPLIIAL